MLSQPKRLEINHHTMKLIVGVIALCLGSLTSFFAGGDIDSISESYHKGGWSQSIFVGSLFAISAFLVAYNGRSSREMIASKIAAVAGLCVALFPCGCDGHDEIIPNVHFLAAAVMFLILAYFCYCFARRAKDKRYPQATARATIYVVCGVVIVLAIVVLGVDHLLGEPLGSKYERLTFYGEAAGLIAFGVSWLTASQVLPLVTRPKDRFKPLKGEVPAD